MAVEVPQNEDISGEGKNTEDKGVGFAIRFLLCRMAGYLWSRSHTTNRWGPRAYPFITPTCCVA